METKKRKINIRDLLWDAFAHAKERNNLNIGCVYIFKNKTILLPRHLHLVTPFNNRYLIQV